MSNHQREFEGRLYRPGFQFNKGDIYRGATVVRGASFYPLNGGKLLSKTAGGMTGPEGKTSRLPYDRARHLLLVERDGLYAYVGAEHQFSSQDAFALAATETEMEAGMKLDQAVDRYSNDSRWLLDRRF